MTPAIGLGQGLIGLSSIPRRFTTWHDCSRRAMADTSDAVAYRQEAREQMSRPHSTPPTPCTQFRSKNDADESFDDKRCVAGDSASRLISLIRINGLLPRRSLFQDARSHATI